MLMLIKSDGTNKFLEKTRQRDSAMRLSCINLHHDLISHELRVAFWRCFYVLITAVGFITKAPVKVSPQCSKKPFHFNELELENRREKKKK